MMNNKLILGTVQMGLDYGINNSSGKVSKNQSIEILEYAFDNGIRILDTAEVYGNAHEIIGVYHKLNPSKKFNIITKLPKTDKINIENKLNKYLEVLNVDSIQTLMFHNYGSYKKNLDLFENLKEIKLSKKIKNIGVSIYTNNNILKVIKNKDIDLIQIPYNLFDNNYQRADVLKKAKKYKKIIHSRSPFLQGLFFKSKNNDSEIVKKLKNEFIILEKIVKNCKTSISNIAINYCLSNELIDNVIVGVDSLNQLKQNLNTGNIKMNKKIIDLVNSIKINDVNLINPFLWPLK
jgi:aryl-alcohol dehydrogenase-like predicted oxidoreductase